MELGGIFILRRGSVEGDAREMMDLVGMVDGGAGVEEYEVTGLLVVVVGVPDVSRVHEKEGL